MVIMSAAMAMPIFHWTIRALWLGFVVYWVVSALRAKRTIRSPAWWRHLVVRLAVVALVIGAAQFPSVRHALHAAAEHRGGDILMGAIGTLLVICGIGLAVAARTYLGRNWGMPMSRKEDPELVTGGPYRLVRHPIYTGIIVALLGSAIGDNLLWLAPLLLSGAYFIYSARREEALMCQQFPVQYPAYMQRTWMLLPFVL
jgi:protein-S-isoprenylcysteine O-methyltransferase Ste14